MASRNTGAYAVKSNTLNLPQSSHHKSISVSGGTKTITIKEVLNDGGEDDQELDEQDYLEGEIDHQQKKGVSINDEERKQRNEDERCISPSS